MFVREVYNPFNVKEESKLHEVNSDITVRQALKEMFGENFVEFEEPTIFVVDNEPILRKDWDTFFIRREQVVFTCPAIGDPFTIIALVIVAAVAVVLATSINVPVANDNSTRSSNSVFTLENETNAVRLGQPIEVPYGLNSHFPAYAARPYNRNISHVQRQFVIINVGQGEHDIHDVLIEDTPIGNFPFSSYQIVPPGSPVTMFRDNVITAAEVRNLELLGTNQDNHAWIGPFVINPAGTEIDTIEVDLHMPNGLGRAKTNGSGGLDPMTIAATWERQELDGDGNAVGPWVTLENYSLTTATSKARLYTRKFKVPKGRYQVRGKRTNTYGDKTTEINKAYWNQLRGYLKDVVFYGNNTVIALQLQASGSLNDDTQNRIRVISTRKLPIYDLATETWSAPTATRSLVWAYCDLFRDQNYGGKYEDKNLNLESLHALNADLESAGVHFDHIFRDKTTIWEAAKIIAQAGQCFATPIGTQFTLIKDEEETIPVAIFNQHNIKKNSFGQEYKFRNLDEPDSLEVEYIDKTTWKPETVTCTVGDDPVEPVNPEKLKLSGVIDRDRAYRIGLQKRAKKKYQRHQVTFTTGLEGHVPSINDLIMVAMSLPKYTNSAGGEIKAFDGTTITSKEKFEFHNPLETHYVLIRDRRGRSHGPYEVTQVENNERQVNLVAAVDPNTFPISDDLGPPIYLFGSSRQLKKKFRVTRVTPQGGEEIKITCSNDDSRVYDGETAVAPELNPPDDSPANPDVSGFLVSQDPAILSQVELTWNRSDGARFYTIETSINGTDWVLEDEVTSTSYTLPVQPGFLYIRVGAVNEGTGTYGTWSGQVGQATSPPEDITGLVLASPFEGEEIELAWASEPTATSYRVRVYTTGDTLIRTFDVISPSAVYTYDQMRDDGYRIRDLRFRVKGVNSLAESTNHAVLDVHNDELPILSNISSTKIFEDATVARYRLSWTSPSNADLRAIWVFGSDTLGFVPDFNANLIFEGLASQIEISIDKVNGGHDEYYWNVGAVDLWGDEINLPTTNLVIAAI